MTTTKQQLEIIDMMADLGCPINTARVMFALARSDGYISQWDISKKIDVAQSVVSVGLNELINAQLVDSETVQGKHGRKVTLHNLNTSLMEAFNKFMEIEVTMEKLEEMINKEFS